MKILSTLMLFAVCMTGSAIAANQSDLIESERQDFRLETVVDGLSNPWAIAFLPGGDMLFTERSGQLYLLQANATQVTSVKGIPEVAAGGQGGLLDIELHPQYEAPGNDWVYLTYSSPQQSDEPGRGANTALMRAKLRDGALVEQEQLFKALPNYPQGVHYGSRVVFDRNGYLYVTVGDRGGRDQVQRLDNYRGKIFRLHDDGSVPDDNPYVGTDGAIASIWSTGHRNPQGLALHPQTGELWSHEHGPRGGDELNLIARGNNYGWPVITYGVNYSGSKITDETARPGLQQPVTYWVPSIAPCGMAFINSDRYPDWNGNVLVGSLKFQMLQRVELDGNRVTHQESLLQGIGRVRAIEQGPDGYIYVATESPGRIIRLLPE
jgi:glucose/arabinose dehydrogenase